MALPNRDAERLDHALDAEQTGREEQKDSVCGDLLKTFSRLQAMNERVESDPTLRNELWRSMMSTIPLSPPAHSPAGNRLSIAGSHTIPFKAKAHRWTRQRSLLPTTMAIALLFALVFGAFAYRQYGGGDGGPNIPAPMAAQLSYEGPNVARCAAQPRTPGSVEELASQQPSEPAIFPRYQDEPASLTNKAEPTLDQLDTSGLIAQSVPVTSIDPAIYDFLEQLLDCSPYLLASTSDVDLDGRYFALFSDDFFRREFEGYTGSGQPIWPTRVWTLRGLKPTILDVRALGDRIVLILDAPSLRKSLGNTALLITKNQGGWRIDEVGDVGTRQWQDTEEETPASPVAGLNYYGPLEAGFALLPCQSNSSGVTDTLCGEYWAQVGPWLYNEYLADSDFTFVISNVSTAEKRFVIDKLGVSVLIGPSETVPIVLNAAAGSYDFQVFDIDSGRLLMSGMLIFKTENEGFAMG